MRRYVNKWSRFTKLWLKEPNQEKQNRNLRNEARENKKSQKSV